ncbi:hypothetical protein [uncultured Tessaracoccus sp.]|uniref:hypothetical protein n=1 Tax=uncultured Tessaracoccus sp. TaxID=905023 RepID=UPI002611552B|nr:hypothetical protein [uncultured Tessaracoccus sp.]
MKLNSHQRFPWSWFLPSVITVLLCISSGSIQAHADFQAATRERLDAISEAITRAVAAADNTPALTTSTLQKQRGFSLNPINDDYSRFQVSFNPPDPLRNGS